MDRLDALLLKVANQLCCRCRTSDNGSDGPRSALRLGRAHKANLKLKKLSHCRLYKNGIIDLHGWGGAIMAHTRIQEVIPDLGNIDRSESDLRGRLLGRFVADTICTHLGREGNGDSPWICPPCSMEHWEYPAFQLNTCLLG